jgi:copper(I)-binding protein
MMRMQRIESITIPAGEMVELKSGGKHVMLINVQEPMPVGEEITIIFSLKDGSTVKTSVPVKDRVKKQSMPDAHEGHDAHAHH